ncbi:MAG: hypothetical protein H6700_02900, partial [Myxococcales bacterium]|nr:hypothetical protein [Myxococcales bacterium]
MIAPPLHPEEDARIAALRRLDVLDTPAESSFDDITHLAAGITGRPIALVSLVDAARQWFKSRVGIDGSETPRELAFCAHAIVGDAPLFEVPDAQVDERFCDNPYVLGAPNVRAYAGAVLMSPDGFPVGTLCVINHETSKLTDRQIDALLRLARVTESLLEQRVVLRQLGAATERAISLERVLRSYTGRSAWSTLDGVAGEGEHVIVEPERDRTYVFADLCGFTRLSGELTAPEVATALNARLGPAAEAVYRHGGDVEKFMGDAVFAVFPTNDAALAFAFDLAAITANAELVRGQPLPFTAGVHRGGAVRCHVGSSGRRD